MLLNMDSFHHADFLLYDILEYDLDLRCEELIKEEFKEECNFDVDDAVQKLERLGIIARVSFLFHAL